MATPAKVTRERAQELLDTARTARMGFRKPGLSADEAEEVIEAYIDLYDKMTRVVACR